ncbi:MAG: ferredoxin [Candidatus Binatia bacterium]
MRVVVNPDLCEGNALCVKEAPEVFALGDDDQARVLVERPDESLRAKVDRAVRRCPRNALTLIED